MAGVLRVLALLLAGLALVLAIAAAGVFALSERKINRTVEAPRDQIAIPSDITSLQRGQHLASAVAVCVDCHGPLLAGRVFIDDPNLGRIVAPNLTRGRGGIGGTLSDADFVRAMRYGVDPTGKPLLIMPADDYNHFGDADLGAIIAYVRSLSPVDNALPAKELRPLARVLFATGQLPLPVDNIDLTARRTPPPTASVTPEYGQYLALNAGCPTCHGPGLSGGRIPQAPAETVQAANITPGGIGNWSEAEFIRAMRTGVRPDGRALSTVMPWPYYAQMTDDELRALWRFLQVVPPRISGTR